MAKGALITAAMVASLGAFLYPKLEFAGAFRTVVPVNNEHCSLVPGLEACEDAYLHEPSGLAYLACSDRASRAIWVPAVLHLNASALAPISTDHISTYNLNTGEISKLAIVGMPESSTGVYLHAIEIWEQEELLTVMINSHRPPFDRTSSSVEGADSVIEIFETEVGGKELRWIKTVQHELIRTPNNMAAVGAREFYLSNDHKRKTHWSRKLEVLYGEPSDLVYCDASGEVPLCKIAATGLTFPNGMARGPGNTIYSASTLAGDVRHWEIQADHTLALIDQFKVPRPIDNIVVDAVTGNIFVTTLPKILDFIKASSPEGYAVDHRAAVEIWKISNDTSAQQYYGASKKIEIVFADSGEVASTATVAVPYKNKLLISGLISHGITVCDL